MIEPTAEFQKVTIDPMDCLSKSWEYLKPSYWLFLGITLVGMLIAGLVPFAILAGPMYCGIFLCWFKLMRGEPVNFELLFKGFDYFVESLIATLIMVGVVLVLIVPAYVLMMVAVVGAAAASEGGNADAAGCTVVALMVLIWGVVLVLSILIGVFTVMVYPLIVDRGLKAIPALKTSIAVGRAHLGGFLGLFALLVGISVVAALLCYIPALLASPWLIGAVAVAYRKVFPELPTADAGGEALAPPA